MKKLLLLTLAIITLSNVGYAIIDNGEVTRASQIAQVAMSPCGVARSYVKPSLPTAPVKQLPSQPSAIVVASNGFTTGR